MSKFMVTGGAGFIGSHLTDFLIDLGHEVVVIDNFSEGFYRHPKAKIVDADINDEKAIEPFFKDLDGCFHLIGIPSVIMTMKDWFHFYEVNMRGSLVVFKLAINAGNIPVVYASSCAVYGETNNLPLKEEQFVQPLSSYGCDKLAVELNAYALAKNYKLPTIGLRFFNVYGPRQNPKSLYSGVITRFIDRLQENKSPMIYGDGQQTRDFIFVKDIASSLIKAMDIASTDGTVVNLCSGVGVSINQLAQQLALTMKKDIEPEHGPKRTYDIVHSVGSIERMRSMGFVNEYDLATGLQETIDSMVD